MVLVDLGRKIIPESMDRATGWPIDKLANLQSPVSNNQSPLTNYNLPMLHLTLLRHGQSTGNAEGFFQGQSDSPLTEHGRRQAAALAARWGNEARAFDRILSSPLPRAAQTAEIVRRALAAPLDFDDLLAERDVGPISGLSRQQARRRYPQPPFMTPYDPFAGTGEGQWRLFLRAGQALQMIVSHPSEELLIVSHGGLLNMLCYAIFGIVPHANFTGPRFHLDNTGFADFTYDPGSHQWRLHTFNDTAHLHRAVNGE